MKATVRWRGVELRHLEALAAVGEQRSFHRAAAALGYSQSAISQQVAALERAVGRRLIDRAGGSRTVAPTDAGLVLIAHAKAIGARLAAAEEELATLESPRTGRLRVGAYRDATARVVPAALAELRRAFPAVRVELTQASAELDLLRMLERGDLDLALVHLPVPRGPFAVEPLPGDDYVLVLPAGAPHPPLSLAELASLPLLGYRECRSVEAAYAHLRASGHELEVAPIADDALTILRFVAAGHGAALLPRLAVEPVEGVEVHELPRGFPTRPAGLAWHAELELRPAAERLVRELVAATEGAMAYSNPETPRKPHVMATKKTAA